jgi:hypothetical protein
MRTCDTRTLILRLTAGGAILWSLAQAATAAGQQHLDVQEMAARIDRMQRQLDASERELEEYRSALANLRQQMQALAPGGGQVTQAESDAGAAGLRQAVADLREEQSVQQAEIAVHEQAKVESRSRYNLKVGGLVLFNAFQNIGQVDSIDVPVIALPRVPGASHGSDGASLRQSLITLDATGPQFWGAHTYANVQMDFFGGLSTADYTSSAGTVRMRAASVSTDWPGWRLHAGLERLLAAPSSPTSYASIGEPAMAWSGNLWAWVPQFTAEKSWSVTDSQQFLLAGALADVPDPGPGSNPYLRTPSAAEQSRYPGAELRTGYSWGSDRASGIGVSGYLSPHDYGQSGSVDAWAGLVDWNFALPARFAFAGEAYKGQALGGLGGGAFKDIVTEYDYGQASYPQGKAIGLRDAGGWTQLKYRPGNWVELNAAFGEDNASAAQLWAAYPSQANPYSGLARNQTVMGNAIFRPRQSFLLSLEYRKLRSWQLTSTANEAQIVGLAAGYEF